jgi:glycerol uptake facilitator-like aquaporin
MLNTYLSEALGSFVFFLIILTTGDKLMIAVALFIGILLAIAGGSRGQLNPMVTFMTFMQGNMASDEALYYVGAQLVGAFAAVKWYEQINKR